MTSEREAKPLLVSLFAFQESVTASRGGDCEVHKSASEKATKGGDRGGN